MKYFFKIFIIFSLSLSYLFADCSFDYSKTNTHTLKKIQILKNKIDLIDGRDVSYSIPKSYTHDGKTVYEGYSKSNGKIILLLTHSTNKLVFGYYKVGDQNPILVETYQCK